METTARKWESPTMLIVLLGLFWAMMASQVCEGLCPTRLAPSVSSSSSSILMASTRSSNKKYLQAQTADNENGGDIARARQRDREAKTLYDYLGASPKDSQEQLKIRYTTLAKTLHPDSNPDGETQSFYYDLSEINAAWEVLKDPLERKRYDRSLQTKEITEGIESLVTMGLESFATTAIPFLQKTAFTTAAAVDASTKAAKVANERATTAYGAFDIKQQIKALEQKSANDAIRATKLQKELEALPTKKIASLEKKPSSRQQQQQQQQQQVLSSGEAQRILKTFQVTTATVKVTTNTMKVSTNTMKPPLGLSNDIKALTETEIKHKDALRRCQSTERATQLAARKVEQTEKAEEAAQKRLEEAQKAFKEAKMSHASAQEENRKATAEEKSSLQSSTRIETTLQKTRDKVRVGLLQQQDVFLVSRAKELKNEKAECEKSSKTYLKEAKELKKKAIKEEPFGKIDRKR